MDIYNYGYPNFQQSYQSSSVYSGKVRAVHGHDGATGINMNPGASIILPDDTKKLMWFISCDNYGIKSAVAYPYGDPVDDHAQNDEKNDEEPIYVTTKEFDELKERFNKLVADLGGKGND